MVIFTWGYKLERLSNFVTNHKSRLANMVMLLYFSTTIYFFRGNLSMIMVEIFLCYLTMRIFKKSNNIYFLSMCLCICMTLTFLMIGRELDLNRWFSVLLSIYASLAILFACIQDKQIIASVMCAVVIGAYTISLLFF